MELTLRFRKIVVCVTGAIPEPAQNAGYSKERLLAQLCKTDTYPFFVDEAHARFFLEDGLYTPVSELNRIRREALEALAQQMMAAGKRIPKALSPMKEQVSINDPGPVTASLRCYTPQSFRRFLQALDVPSSPWGQIDTLLLPPECFRPAYYPVLEALRQKGIACYLAVPPVIKKEELHTLPLDCPYIDGFLAGTLGALALLISYQKPIWGDMGLNLYQEQTSQVLHDLGLSRLTLSPEIARETTTAPWIPHTEVIAYGNIPVMISEHCPVGAHYGTAPCAGRGKRHYLQKERGGMYPILCQGGICRPQVLSAAPIHLRADEISRLKQKGYRHFRLQITEEPLQELEEIVWLMKK